MFNAIKRNKSESEGFTLIELLITVVILAVIMGIAIPIYVNNKHTADDAAAKSEVVSIARAIDAGIGTGTLTAGDPAGTVQITGDIATQSQKQPVGAALVFINSATGAWCASEGKYNETSLSAGVVASNSKHCTDAQTLAAGVGGGGGGGGGGSPVGHFVVSDQAGNIYYSADSGVTWNLSDASNAPGTPAEIVSNNNGTFVAFPSSGNVVQYSTNYGVNWSTATLPISGDFIAATYGNGLFMASDSSFFGGTVTSPDGIVWTSASSAMPSVRSLGAGGGFFVAGDQVGGMVGYSNNNGSSWSAGSWLGHSDTNITYGSGKFVVGGGLGTSAYSSDHGATWTEVALPAGQWNDPVSDGTNFVMTTVAQSGNDVVYSSTGTSWSSSIIPAGGAWTSDGTAVSNGFWLVGNEVNHEVAISSDNGATWAITTMPGGISTGEIRVAGSN